MSGSVHVRGHRLSGGRKPKLDSIRNDINVTPLVDVVLVLLIIFMVITPLMARGREIPALPKTRNHSQEKDKLQPVIALDANGDLWFDKDKLGPIDDNSLKEMGRRVEQSWKAPKHPEGAGKVYIKAAAELPYGKVYPLITYVNRELRVSSIELATNELKDKK